MGAFTSREEQERIRAQREVRGAARPPGNVNVGHIPSAPTPALDVRTGQPVAHIPPQPGGGKQRTSLPTQIPLPNKLPAKTSKPIPIVPNSDAMGKEVKQMLGTMEGLSLLLSKTMVKNVEDF